MDYSNMVRLKGEELRNAVKRAPSMDDCVFLIYFHTQQAWGEDQIIEMGRIAGFRWRLALVRKTIKALVTTKKLVKVTSEKVTGERWRAAPAYKPRY